jgi:hypothetical protein
VSRPALRSTQPRIQCVPGILYLGVKRPCREANHSPPSSVEVNAWSYNSTPNTPSWHGAQLNTGTSLPFTFSLLQEAKKTKREHRRLILTRTVELLNVCKDGFKMLTFSFVRTIFVVMITSEMDAGYENGEY